MTAWILAHPVEASLALHLAISAVFAFIPDERLGPNGKRLKSAVLALVLDLPKLLEAMKTPKAKTDFTKTDPSFKLPSVPPPPPETA